MKNLLGENNFLKSKDYENSLEVNTKKSKGIYYTPKIIVDYILNKTLKNHDIIANPSPKVLDLTCGCGNFLLEAYDVLYNMIWENVFKLREIYGEDYWVEENIHNHIITNCIYGVDIDEEAIRILKKSLEKKGNGAKVDRLNIYCCDSLKVNWEHSFDYIIGNPPYIGHKMIDKDYKKFLIENYSQVYRGKADLYFCFYKKISDLLGKDGVSSIITPRYFLESPSAKYLRDFIKEKIYIEEMIDFLGADIFGYIGVSSCITTFRIKEKERKSKILRIRDENLNILKSQSLDYLINKNQFEEINLNKELLEKEWILVSSSDEKFYRSIEARCNYSLDEIATSFQGIITGCDKAFILKKDDDRIEHINNILLKKWVKNKDISKYIVNESNQRLIYSNDIDIEDDDYKCVIESCILKYRERLESRRECKNNIRKWYELQWGRDKRNFERKKIMYPYKCSENKFAIDYSNNFCSADVYSFYIKEQYLSKFSYEYMVGILNSKVYDKYFKITAKKISKNAYDYYPNKVMKLKIFKDDNYNKIEELSRRIIGILLSSEYSQEIEKQVENLQKEIDILVSQSLGVQSP